LVPDQPLQTTFCHCLHSANSHLVSVPRYQLSMHGCRAFSASGPTVWNTLTEDMWDLEFSADSDRQYWPVQCIRGLLQ